MYRIIVSLHIDCMYNVSMNNILLFEMYSINSECLDNLFFLYLHMYSTFFFGRLYLHMYTSAETVDNTNNL